MQSFEQLHCSEGIVLARAVQNSELSDEILECVRQKLG